MYNVIADRDFFDKPELLEALALPELESMIEACVSVPHYAAKCGVDPGVGTLLGADILCCHVEHFVIILELDQSGWKYCCEGSHPLNPVACRIAKTPWSFVPVLEQ